METDRLVFADHFLRTYFADVTTFLDWCQLEEGRLQRIKRLVATALVVNGRSRSTLDTLTRSQKPITSGTLELYGLSRWTRSTFRGFGSVSKLLARGAGLMTRLLAPSARKARVASLAYSISEACSFDIARTSTVASTRLLASRSIKTFVATFAASTV
jgi:hypothetical protein